MIRSVKIDGYRGLAAFEMNELGRINLIVGKNNAGKSSLLEAIYLLVSGSNPTALMNILARRGEQALPESSPGQVGVGHADVSHLFHNHPLGDGAKFSVSTANGAKRAVVCELKPATADRNPQAFAQMMDEGALSERLALWISGTGFALAPLPLTRSGALRPDIIQPHINFKSPSAETGFVQFIAGESLNVQQLGQQWSAIVLTGAEDRAVQALQVIEPDVERIAQVPLAMMNVPGSGFIIPTRGGFYLRLKGEGQRLPIGSFGDGMWRLLAISVSMARAKDSVLLIDEIDTGLHYSVMKDMWRLINQASIDFNVQVFATTHSQDCVYALACECKDVEKSDLNQITLQRIEVGKKRSIAFTEAEIQAVAARNIEAR